jgi:hypothetical protein
VELKFSHNLYRKLIGEIKMELTMKLAGDVEGVGRSGERVTLAMQPADTYDPTELPTYLAGYKPFGRRADEASQVILVDKDEGKHRNFSSDDAFRRVPVKGSDGGAVNEVDPSSSLTDYKVINRFIGSFVPKQTEMQATFNARLAASRRAKRAVDLDR